eukprot:Pgem_evm1s18536
MQFYKVSSVISMAFLLVMTFTITPPTIGSDTNCAQNGQTCHTTNVYPCCSVAYYCKVTGGDGSTKGKCVPNLGRRSMRRRRQEAEIQTEELEAPKPCMLY